MFRTRSVRTRRRLFLKGPADLSHTVQFDILGAQLAGGSCEQALVHLLHTSHDHAFENLGVSLKGDPHLPVSDAHILGLHAKAADFQSFR